MSGISVSVIIPVYNAERFLRNAVESAVCLAEVGEVILVEDHSPDNSIEICKLLQQEYSKVKLHHHPDRENRGAGASRNLGIGMAACEYISFLDADDWYLPNRFEAERVLFQDKSVDGVYGATGFFYNDREILHEQRLTTVSRKVKHEDLLRVLLTAGAGRFHTNAITVRRSLFEKTGVFDTSLRLHQDTHLWLRMAFFGKLVPGVIDRAVSIRRVHDQNRISSRNSKSRGQLYQKVFESFRNYKGVPPSDFRMIFKRYAVSLSDNKVKQLWGVIKTIVSKPSILGKLF
jgi:glycosyltransferase involved in cell wall biosynthesis